MSIYLVFPVDQQLRADEGRLLYHNLTRTRYCSLGTRCVSYTNTQPILNLPTLRTNSINTNLADIHLSSNFSTRFIKHGRL